MGTGECENVGLKLQVFEVGFNGPYLALTSKYYIYIYILLSLSIYIYIETGIKFHSMIDKEL